MDEAAEAVDEDAGALLGVIQGAGEAVDLDYAGNLVEAASGAGEAVDEDTGALLQLSGCLRIRKSHR